MTNLEKNAPMIADKARAIANTARGHCKAPRHVVVCLHYGCLVNPAGMARYWIHRAPRAALRRAGSVCAGKLKARDSYAVAIVAPCGAVMSYRELQGVLA